MSESETGQGAAEVEAAWQAVRKRPTPETMAAYGEAFAVWKALALRPVGRPPSGDAAALGGTERTQALRARQQESAEKWGRVSPHLQKLRHAIQADDSSAIVEATIHLVNATETTLERVSVVHAQPAADHVVIEGWNGKQRILGFVPRSTLEAYFERAGLGGDEANLLADANRAALAKVMADKLERGEYRPWSRLGATVPCIDVAAADIEASRQTLSDEVLPLWDEKDGTSGSGRPRPARFRPERPERMPARWIEISRSRDPQKPTWWSVAARGDKAEAGSEAGDTRTLGEARQRAKALAAAHGIRDVIIRNRK